RCGPQRDRAQRDHRQERADPRRRADRRRPGGRPRALHRLSGRHRRGREGPEGRAELKVALLTREYPPEVYGGAGVHVEYLARELARLVDLTVHCWGEERSAEPGGPAIRSYRPWQALAGGAAQAAALEAGSVD